MSEQQKKDFVSPNLGGTLSQAERKEKIEWAALDHLKLHGYRSSSMLAIAKYAGTSNQTMYRLYNNKQDLFRAVIERKTQCALAEFSAVQDQEAPLLSQLSALGKRFLLLFTSDDFRALDRAAVSDVSDSNTLGKLLRSAGKNQFATLIADVCNRALEAGEIRPIANAAQTPHNIAQIYCELLLGDLQIVHATGAVPLFSNQDLEDRADRAFLLFKRLFCVA